MLIATNDDVATDRNERLELTHRTMLAIHNVQ